MVIALNKKPQASNNIARNRISSKKPKNQLIKNLPTLIKDRERKSKDKKLKKKSYTYSSN